MKREKTRVTKQRLILVWIWLVDKMARVSWTNQRATLSTSKSIMDYFRHSIENCSSFIGDDIWHILQTNREKLFKCTSKFPLITYVKRKETSSLNHTVNCISSPASWATQGHQPYTLFDSNRDTVSTLLLALPSSYEGSCSRPHLLALLAGLGIRFRFSSSWPGKKTTTIFGWKIWLTEITVELRYFEFEFTCFFSYLLQTVSNSFAPL